MFGLVADPNGDLVRQLTRIADALSKPGPSPWLEWARNLFSFIAGILTAFLSIEAQARLGDSRERRKMRRIVYVELTHSFRWVYEMLVNLDSVSERRPRSPNSKGEIHPPSIRFANPSLTFDGREYMRQHSSVCYELAERQELSRMYEELSRLAPGKSATIGDLQVLLVHFGEMYTKHKVVRDNFRKFGGDSRKTIEAIANKFADYNIPIEDLVALIPNQSKHGEQNQR